MAFDIKSLLKNEVSAQIPRKNATFHLFYHNFKLKTPLLIDYQAISINARKGVWVSASFRFKP